MHIGKSLKCTLASYLHTNNEHSLLSSWATDPHLIDVKTTISQCLHLNSIWAKMLNAPGKVPCYTSAHLSLQTNLQWWRWETLDRGDVTETHGRMVLRRIWEMRSFAVYQGDAEVGKSRGRKLRGNWLAWIYLENKHPFNGLFSRTTWVSRNQKDKTNLDFNEATDNGVANHLHLAPHR